MASISSEAQVKVFEGSLKDLLKQAKQNDKDALVMVSTTWCGPCKLFMKKMVPSTEMGDYINSRFIFGHYDVDTGDPNGISKTYGVSAYPTFLIIDQKGKEIGRAVGAQGDVEKMKEAIESAYSTPVIKLRKEFEKDPVAKADEYISALREEYRNDEIQKALDKLCGVMDPETVISKYIRDIKVSTTEDFKRPLARAISSDPALLDKYGAILQNPITNMAKDVLNSLGSKDTEKLASLRKNIASYDKYTSNFARFVCENGEAVIKGDVPVLLDQIKRRDAYGPQVRLTAIFAIMRKTKADNTIDKYKAQMKDVLDSLDSEEKADKKFIANNLRKYVE